MEAQVTLHGWVGSDIEHKQGPVSTFATFRLATTPRLRRGGDWVDGETIWVTVTAFRNLADNLAGSVVKGDPVLVAGKLRTQVWGTDEDRHERLVIEAATIGHDLTRGTSAFKKNERQTVSDEDANSYLGEAIKAVEQAAQSKADPEAVPVG